MKEEWRELDEFPGQPISNLGRVKGRRGGIKKTYVQGGVITTGMQKASGGSRPVGVAHLVYRAFIGDVPDGLHVTFKDGDSSNCRTDNLDVGTTKCRTKYKLSEDDVLDIFEKRARGVNVTDLAEQYDVSIGTIGDVIYRRRYTHVDVPDYLIDAVNERKTKLTKRQVKWIRQYLKLGIKGREIAEMFDVHESMISRIKNGTRH